MSDTPVFPAHTYGLKQDGVDRCPLCPGPHGGPGPCDHGLWTSKQRRFVAAHLEEYTAAYENPDARAGSHILARLEEERHNLPRGHICSEPGGCPAENHARGIPACPVCRARWQAQANQMCPACQKLPRQFRPRNCGDCAALGGMELGAEIGRTSSITPPAPMTIMVDYFAGNMGIRGADA